MKITLEYRNPTSTHCNVAVFINGALAGTLCMRQEELGTFDMIIHHGAGTMDTVLSRGNPDTPERTARTICIDIR